VLKQTLEPFDCEQLLLCVGKAVCAAAPDRLWLLGPAPSSCGWRAPANVKHVALSQEQRQDIHKGLTPFTLLLLQTALLSTPTPAMRWWMSGAERCSGCRCATAEAVFGHSSEREAAGAGQLLVWPG